MKITEVRIKIAPESNNRLQAFCSTTFDNCFVVRDLKIIAGNEGPIVWMPSRKLTAHCPHCRCKNHLRARYCNDCGRPLPQDVLVQDQTGRLKLFADIAHPITPYCRDMIQRRVLEEYRLEQQRAQQPGYVSRYDDYFNDCYNRDTPAPEPAPKKPRAANLPPDTEPPRQPRSNDQFGTGIFP
ncbi:MAG: septation protein SpoVG family protein [Candidatus Andersenbacteria bacterium]|nr:septation protein SpoVG family protein [Candidatus Andersenbacteria bacterium]